MKRGREQPSVAMAQRIFGAVREVSRPFIGSRGLGTPNQAMTLGERQAAIRRPDCRRGCQASMFCHPSMSRDLRHSMFTAMPHPAAASLKTSNVTAMYMFRSGTCPACEKNKYSSGLFARSPCTEPAGDCN